MISRFKIPDKIQSLIQERGRVFSSISRDELLAVQSKIKALRGTLSINPDVTVAIIALNEEENIFATLKSISEQQTTFRVQVLVIDNNSSDQTLQIAELCGAEVAVEFEQGAAFARQKGLLLSKGRFYVSCDADTLYPEFWLTSLVNPLAKSSYVSVSYSLHSLIDERKKYSLGLHIYQYTKLLYVFIRHCKRSQLNCGGASMAFRVIDALKIGGYNKKLKRGSDGYIALQLSEFGKIRMISTHDAFVYTSNRRILKDGSIFNAFVIRFKYGIRHMFSFLTTQKIPTS